MPTVAEAGAWPQAPGDTQVIVMLDSAQASRVFDLNGDTLLPVETWEQDEVTVFVDRGLTPRLTVTGKLTYKSYATQTDSFSGLNFLELGGRYTLYQGDTYVFAVGASIIGGGEGRRSDFDLSGRQGTDYDLRVYGGRNVTLWGMDGFVTLEMARHLRENEAHQWRMDATVGLRPSPKWLLMAQTFAGRTDEESWGYAQWTNSQFSVVRRFGTDNQTSLQLALRRTVTGRNVPVSNAVVVALWKTF